MTLDYTLISSVFSGGQEQSIGFMLSFAEPESSGIKISSRKQDFSIWFMIDVKHRIQILIIHRYVYMYVELYYEDLVLGSS